MVVSAHIGPWLRQEGDHLFLDVLVCANASRSRIVGIHQKRLKIQLTEAPVAGRANHALTQFLALHLDVSRAQVQVVGGQSSRNKRVCLLGVGRQRALLRLSPSQGREFTR